MKNSIGKIILFLSFVILLVLSSFFMYKKDKYRDYNLNNDIFKVTPAKICASGPYMRTSDPELQKLCSNYTNQDFAQISCSRGFHGRPVHWDYSEPSNSEWKDTRCNCSINYNSPCPL